MVQQLKDMSDCHKTKKNGKINNTVTAANSKKKTP